MTTTGDWNPEQYARFRAERSQPFYDIAGLVERRPGMRVVDLGCGDGSLTAWLHEELQAAETLGVDSSESMLAQAGPRASASLRFERGDIAAWAPGRQFDLVFSNAALQWVGGHEALFPRLFELVAPGGQFAVQMPTNDQHPSHVIAEEVAASEPWHSAMGGFARPFDRVLPPARYAELLWEHGFDPQHVRLRIYPHVLPGVDQVVEWVKGTYLTAYESRLTPELYTSYLDEYSRRLFAALGDKRPYLYTYPRILMWGTRAG
jgi:trans-aconitate 2-methyltransferase